MILFVLCLIGLAETFDKGGNIDVFIPDPNAYRLHSTSLKAGSPLPLLYEHTGRLGG